MSVVLPKWAEYSLVESGKNNVPGEYINVVQHYAQGQPDQNTDKRWMNWIRQAG